MFGDRPVPPLAVPIRRGSRASPRQVWPKVTVVLRLPFQPPAAKSIAWAAPERRARQPAPTVAWNSWSCGSPGQDQWIFSARIYQRFRFALQNAGVDQL